jgi:hypothetical protein
MKFKNLLLGGALFVSASVAQAATSFYPTDGDINFILETGDLGDYTLAIFDEEADIGVGPSLEVTPPELIFWDGVSTLSDADANTLTIDGDFVLAVQCPACGAWTGGEVDLGSPFTTPDANAYVVTFGDIRGLELIVDVAPVPVPAAVWLFGSGLLGLVGVARRRAA